MTNKLPVVGKRYKAKKKKSYFDVGDEMKVIRINYLDHLVHFKYSFELFRGEGEGNDKAVSYIPYYTKGLHNVAEQLFYQIRAWDKPNNNVFSKIALELCDEFLSSKE